MAPSLPSSVTLGLWVALQHTSQPLTDSKRAGRNQRTLCSQPQLASGLSWCPHGPRTGHVGACRRQSRCPRHHERAAWPHRRLWGSLACCARMVSVSSMLFRILHACCDLRLVASHGVQTVLGGPPEFVLVAGARHDDRACLFLLLVNSCVFGCSLHCIHEWC